jgi:hypothetical protein
MNGALILRFSILLAAGILFFESLNLFDDWTFQLMPVRFVGAALASGLAFLAAISHFPPKIDIRRQAILFWGIAILLRIIALPLVPADDLIRYQWEGKIQRAGYNPYLVTVSDPQLDNLRHDFPEAARINHPELHAFDAPGAESLFKFLSGITDRPLFYKIIFAMADLAVAAVLLCLIGGDQRYREAAWYAWNPLVVYSFAGTAHFDSIMILSLIAGIFALVKSTSSPESKQQWLWALAAAVFFGIAISLNIVAASLLLLCVFALRWRALVLALTFIIPVLFALPFGFPKVRIWDSLVQLTQLSQRSLLVADRRHVLAKSTPEKFSLPADHDRLCSRGFIFVRAELEAWNGLGAGNSAGPQPNSVSVVLYLDLAACDLATGLRLARSVDHDFRLLFVLG